MKCCVQCFQNEYLVRFIEQKGDVGNCEFCGAEQLKTMDAHDLGGVFEPLLELYEPAEDETHLGSESLAECLEEWDVFSDKLAIEDQNSLLDEIMYGRERYKRRFEHHLSSDEWGYIEDSLFTQSSRDIWEEFADHIKRKRRFLPKIKQFSSLTDPNEWLPEYIKATDFELTPASQFFRAREGFIRETFGYPKPFPPDQMQAPPVEKARRNRANPAGISYLYVAEEESTAVAEIRTFVGAVVSICRIHPKKNLKVADLTKYHGVSNPFGHKNLSSLVRRNAFLNILNEELSRPVNPEDSEVEYVPTQYLAEVILNAGYDGIRYKSALRQNGTNLVFFQPDDLEIQPDARLVTVVSIEVAYRGC
jgi:hypothetical protein